MYVRYQYFIALSCPKAGTHCTLRIGTPNNPKTAKWPREVLGLQPGASSRKVTAAYRTLSRQHHPDKAGDTKEANQMMGELAAANTAIQSSLDTDLGLGDFLD